MKKSNLTPGTKISKNFKLKKKIITVSELNQILLKEKSIYVGSLNGIKNTSFIEHWSWRKMITLLNCGELWTIEKIITK